MGAVLLGLLLFGCSTEQQRRTVEAPTAAATPPLVAGTADSDWVAATAESTGIPERVLRGYVDAALTSTREDPGCTMAWNVLAGIGYIESSHGRANGASIDADGVARPSIIGIALNGDGVAAIPDSDNGNLDGDQTWDRAVGPMQFIPQTWIQWGEGDPQNIDAAALAAARYLCDSGGRIDTAGGWTDAILTYNRSYQYAENVAAQANYYAEAS